MKNLYLTLLLSIPAYAICMDQNNNQSEAEETQIFGNFSDLPKDMRALIIGDSLIELIKEYCSEKPNENKLKKFSKKFGILASTNKEFYTILHSYIPIDALRNFEMSCDSKTGGRIFDFILQNKLNKLLSLILDNKILEKKYFYVIFKHYIQNCKNKADNEIITKLKSLGVDINGPSSWQEVMNYALLMQK